MKCLLGFSVLVLALATNQIAVCQVETASVEAQPADVRLDHEVVVKNQRVLNIFLDVLRGTRINGGFAEIAGCSGLPEGSLKLKQGTTIREAMDALVAANPSYQWTLEDEVIVLVPLGGVPLLDARIVQFQVDGTDREIPATLGLLLRFPEVREREAQLNLKPALGQGGGPGVYDEHPIPRKDVPVHINIQNLSLREAFNKIVRASPKPVVWVYHENSCDADKTYTVDVASDY